MNLRYECHVGRPLKEVLDGFDEKLFRYLSPAFPLVKIREFGGIRKGDLVDLNLNFLLFSWNWTSLITASGETETGFMFVDRAEKMPPFLSCWEHRHILEKSGEDCIIRDEIDFLPGKGWPAWLVRIMIELQMRPRKEKYRRYFEGKQAGKN